MSIFLHLPCPGLIMYNTEIRLILFLCASNVSANYNNITSLEYWHLLTQYLIRKILDVVFKYQLVIINRIVPSPLLSEHM